MNQDRYQAPQHARCNTEYGRCANRLGCRFFGFALQLICNVFSGRRLVTGVGCLRKVCPLCTSAALFEQRGCSLSLRFARVGCATCRPRVQHESQGPCRWIWPRADCTPCTSRGGAPTFQWFDTPEPTVWLPFWSAQRHPLCRAVLRRCST